MTAREIKAQIRELKQKVKELKDAYQKQLAKEKARAEKPAE